MIKPSSIDDIRLLQTVKEQFDPRITALLIIDMQNDYISEKGRLRKRGVDVKKLQKPIPKMNRLIKRQEGQK